jgi:hypothetical protein
MSGSQAFPQIRHGQVAVVHAEGLTGIVLTIDRSRRAHGAEDRYLVFDSVEDARRHAEEVVRLTPLVECVLLNEAGGQVQVFRDAAALARAAKSRKPRGLWSRLFGSRNPQR